MSIPSTDERLSQYLDGDLSPEETAALEHELAHDAELRADLDAMRMVVGMLRDEGTVRAPLGFHAAVMERVEAEYPEAPWWQRFLKRPFGIPAQGWGVVLAAAAVLVVVQVGRDGDDAQAPYPSDPVWRDTPAEVEQAPAVLMPTRDAEVADEEATPPVARPLPEARKPADAAEGKLRAAEASRQQAEERRPEKEAAARAEKGDQRKVGTDTGKVPVLRTPPSGLTLLTREPAALRDVLALVARFEGSVTTPSGAAVTHATLESAEESIVVTIPSAQLAAFQTALESLGSVRADFDTDRLYSGETMEVPLTFKLVGGSAGTSDAPASPAARKSRVEHDMLEAPEASQEVR